MRRTFSALATGSLIATVALVPATAAAAPNDTDSQRDTGPLNAITDVPGIQVGQYQRTDDGYLTGTTVVHAPGRAVAGVSVSGGAPGTRETDLLDPRNRVQRVDAITLSGGSAYGLVTASGVMRWLEENDQGFRVGSQPREVVPIVPAAIIFDLGRGGEFTARPTAEFGYRAIAAADDGAVAKGVVGAGTGAVSGGLKGGVGTASIKLDNGIVVGALVVVNSAGSTVNPETCNLYAAFLEVDNEFEKLRPGGGKCESSDRPGSASEKMNTTIAVVATNAPLDKAQANKMAGVAHDGLARAISPVHTLFDGDTVFAMSTGEGPAWEVNGHVRDLNAVYTAAANTLSRAIVHAMLSANTVGEYESYCDVYKSACRGGGGSAGGPPSQSSQAQPASSGSGGSQPGRSDLAANIRSVVQTPSPLGLVLIAGFGLLVLAYGVVALRRRYTPVVDQGSRSHD